MPFTPLGKRHDCMFVWHTCFQRFMILDPVLLTFSISFQNLSEVQRRAMNAWKCARLMNFQIKMLMLFDEIVETSFKLSLKFFLNL